MHMDVSVVIPAFNEERLLASTLEAVRHACAPWDRRAWSTECVVCNNNSSDKTPEIAESMGARVVHEPVNQIARARNTGARAAHGRWLVFLDADSHPTPELFDLVAKTIESGGWLAGGSTLKLDTQLPGVRLITSGWNVISRVNRWMAGAFIFVDANVFHAIDGFDERLFASEEIDLSKRLKKFARTDGRGIRILTDAPLLTSGRKVRLYTHSELLRFIMRAVFRPKATVTNKEACHPWYDGRR